jgi:RimK family alpha-L-glutamate ligase
VLIPILAARTGWHTDELRRALAARGHEGVVLPYEGLVARLGGRAGSGGAADGASGSAARLTSDDRALLDAPAVLARIIPAGSLEQIIFRVDALHWLESRGVRVMNPPRAIERTVDKFYTSALLQDAGVATPETVVCERSDVAMEAFRQMGDAVVKPLFGSMGLGMVRVSDEEVAWRVFRALEAIRGVYYLQRTVDHGGRDVRAFVIGDRVVGAIERRARDPDGAHGWRTNVSRGGSAHAVELPAAWDALAVRAARAVGADYAGVDLLPTGDGAVYVLEVNGIPGWRGLQQATSLDVAGAITDHLLAPSAAARR